MRRTVYRYSRPDGGIDVVTVGPLSRAAGVVRIGLVIVFSIGLAMNIFSWHWSTAGVFLLLFALALSNYAKRRQARGEGGATPWRAVVAGW